MSFCAPCEGTRWFCYAVNVAETSEMYDGCIYLEHRGERCGNVTADKWKKINLELEDIYRGRGERFEKHIK